MTAKTILESDGTVTITGTVLTAGKSTETDRIYPLESMVKAVNEFNKREQPQFGSILDVDNFSTFTDLANVTHKVERLWVDGDDIKVRVKLLDTPRGKDIRDTLEHASSREISIGYKPTPVMLGELNEIDGEMVLRDFELTRIDILPED